MLVDLIFAYIVVINLKCLLAMRLGWAAGKRRKRVVPKITTSSEQHRRFSVPLVGNDGWSGRRADRCGVRNERRGQELRARFQTMTRI